MPSVCRVAAASATAAAAVVAAVVVLSAPTLSAAVAVPTAGRAAAPNRTVTPVTYGPRPFFLVDDMAPSALKERLGGCAGQAAAASDFSIGHRGAALLFPEHTKESYVAAARMGAGLIECDVTFTKDKELVCRHSQCDLHTTTNILVTPLASKCTTPFSPAADGAPASAKCCTSDVTLAEFRTLTGKMDGADAAATTAEAYLAGTAPFRTDLYSASGATGTLLTHAESIELIRSLGAKFAPELKAPAVAMPFDGLTQVAYAQQLIDEYKAAGVPAEHVWAQSFRLDDVLYWVRAEPRFANQAVYLDGRYDVDGFNHTAPSTYAPTMRQLYEGGVRIVAPPLWMLLASDGDGAMGPSVYARAARAAGLNLLTWTLERSGSPPAGWYFQTVADLVRTDGDVMVALDVLARQVKVLGVFSDWPATVTYYANCVGLA